MIRRRFAGLAAGGARKRAVGAAACATLLGCAGAPVDFASLPANVELTTCYSLSTAARLRWHQSDHPLVADTVVVGFTNDSLWLGRRAVPLSPQPAAYGIMWRHLPPDTLSVIWPYLTAMVEARFVVIGDSAAGYGYAAADAEGSNVPPITTLTGRVVACPEPPYRRRAR